MPELRNQHCAGSSYGWLFIVDKNFVPRLFNPFTKESFEPPPLPRFEEKVLPQKSFKAVLWHDPSKTRDFTVLFLYDRRIPHMAFWRHGTDSTWVCIPSDQLVSDAIFYKGKFYLALLNELAVIPDLGVPHPTMKVVMPLCLFGIKYLVDFMGELLLVRRFLKNMGDSLRNGHFATTGFEVYQLDFEKRWSVKCLRIGDFTIFLGVSSPLVVHSQMFPGCRKNSIYFTDVALKFFAEVHGYDDIGFYDFRKRIAKPFFPPEILQSSTKVPPIWLTPNVNRLVPPLPHTSGEL